MQAGLGSCKLPSPHPHPHAQNLLTAVDDQVLKVSKPPLPHPWPLAVPPHIPEHPTLTTYKSPPACCALPRRLDRIQTPFALSLGAWCNLPEGLDRLKTPSVSPHPFLLYPAGGHDRRRTGGSYCGAWPCAALWRRALQVKAGLGWDWDC